MTLRIVCAFVAVIFLTGCNQDATNPVVPPPLALDSDAMGVFCGMSLLEHPGPKGQIITASRIDPFWFTSVRDTVAFTLMPDQPRDIRAIYVSDMARATTWEEPGATNWIDARKAFFVIESRKQGGIVPPEADMVALLKASLLFADLTDGAFDPTVQPLWQLYVDHFSSERPDPEGPSPQKLAETLTKVGHNGLLVSEDRVALTKRGAAITLNGIAQGYATDRVVDRLRSAGLSTTLVNMGEIRAIGARPEGTPWRVGLADPDRPGALTETINLVDRAIATSAGAGFRFDRLGRFTHLFDPTTGRSPSLYSTVSVIASTATEADALSTAFSLMPLSRIQDIVAVRAKVQARIVEAGGTLIVCGA